MATVCWFLVCTGLITLLSAYPQVFILWLIVQPQTKFAELIKVEVDKTWKN